jgi:hypothetical protein
MASVLFMVYGCVYNVDAIRFQGGRRIGIGLTQFLDFAIFSFGRRTPQKPARDNLFRNL